MEEATCMYCKLGCKHLERGGTKWASCSYILHMKEPRGCKAGKNCSKYCRGKRIRSNEYIVDGE